MRITNSIIYDQLLSGLRNFQTTNSELATRLATQKKILAPSEDVAGTMRAMDYQVSINDNNQYKNNITGATTNLNLTSTVLNGVSNTLSTLVNLISNTSGSTDPVIVASSSQQAAQVRDELDNYANTKNGGGYLFSGFKTDVQPYALQPAPVTVPPTIPSTVYVYNGDNNVLQVPIDRGATMPANVTGDEAFSLSPGALPASINLSNGQTAQYTAGAGTTINVTILQSDGVTVADTFSFSNVMDMANVISSAIGSNDTARLEAMADPLNKMRDQVNALQADVGTRINALKDQSSQLDQNTNTLKDALSAIQDVDMNETALQLSQTNTALQALYSTSSKILPQSLFDFLR
jgi:flagellar hook-associated protein 3 FlgL